MANASETANERVCAGHDAVPAALRRLADLIAASPHNLVSRRERPAVLERHVLESDALAAALRPTGDWMDLGTGGGLPGLVLAYRHPQVEWTLVDATAKKVRAVSEFAAALDLANVAVLQGRAESLGHEGGLRGSFDGVVARAVAPLVTLAELARGFLRPNGIMVAVKGPAWREEVQAARGAMRTLQLDVLPPQRLGTTARETWVVTMRARGTPPAGYPRRTGVPKQDPLH